MATIFEINGRFESFSKDSITIEEREILSEPESHLSDSEQTRIVYRGLYTDTKKRIPTYHKYKDAKYVLPNDTPEHVRLETQAAHLSNVMNHRILHAPVPASSATHVLDIGCGTGCVTDVMSAKYSTADCIGLDLFPVPSLRTQRSNVHFFRGNAATQTPTQWTPNNARSKTFTQNENLFDHIFSRLLILGMSNWPTFIKTEFNLLKPGGWLEVHDLAWDWYGPDGALVSDGWTWLKLLNDNFEGKKGLDTHCGRKARQWMEDAGFEDVQVFEYCFPLCGETETTLERRQLGKFNAESVPAMLHFAIEKAITDGREMTPEIQRVIEEMRAEMKACLKGGQGLTQPIYVTIGRKPI